MSFAVYYTILDQKLITETVTSQKGTQCVTDVNIRNKTQV